MTVAQAERIGLQFELLTRHGFASYVDAGYCLDAPEAIPAGGCIPLSIAAWGVHHYAAQLVVGREDAPASEPIEDSYMTVTYRFFPAPGGRSERPCGSDDEAIAIALADPAVMRVRAYKTGEFGELASRDVWPTADRARAEAERIAELEARATSRAPLTDAELLAIHDAEYGPESDERAVERIMRVLRAVAAATGPKSAADLDAARQDQALIECLQANPGFNLISDDAGRWALSTSGMQQVPPEGGFTESTSIMSIMHPHQWKPSVREAIRFVLQQMDEETQAGSAA